MRNEVCAAHFRRAEAGQVRGVLLAIDHRQAMLAAEPHQRGQRDLRRVRPVGEHLFAKNRLPDGHAIQPAGQFAVDPGLDAVRMTGRVQRAVRRDHVGHDPGA